MRNFGGFSLMDPLSTKKSKRGNFCGLLMAAGNFGRLSLMDTLSTKKSRRGKTKVMESQIWENFPKDLFKDVLARLPIATIIRFRTVCQQWNNLITSQSFSQHCVQVSKANPWFYTASQDNFKAMYDPFVERWYYPNKFRFDYLPVSSVGGLVCFFDYFNQDLYVCNPLTQCFKKLPAGSIKRLFRVGMTLNGIGGYKVLCLDRYNSKYEIYDSITKNWGHRGKLPEYIIMKVGRIEFNPVSIDDTLYFMHFGPKGIVSCNTSTGVWTQHLIQAPLHSSYLALAESDGQIMLVGLVTENDVTCVCIWEVQKVTFLLKEVDRRQFSEFQGRQVNLFCVGNKGLLLCYLRSRNMYHMVTYNVATRKWGKGCLPYGRKPHKANHHIYMRGTAFQPCLTAVP